ACEWALTREGNALRVRPAPRSVPVSGEARDVSGELRERLRLSLDLSLAEAPLEAVLKSFGQILEVPVEIEEGVRGSVTIELSGTPFEGALNAVCAANDCRWSLESGGVGSKLRVTSALP
ncbi:MAG: hypothetical protein KDD47_17675, partial [Acidobacteria bacterium]|nr:hypothetical protein [Acidobacteriota bacterium]